MTELNPYQSRTNHSKNFNQRSLHAPACTLLIKHKSFANMDHNPETASICTVFGVPQMLPQLHIDFSVCKKAEEPTLSPRHNSNEWRCAYG